MTFFIAMRDKDMLLATKTDYFFYEFYKKNYKMLFITEAQSLALLQTHGKELLHKVYCCGFL